MTQVRQDDEAVPPEKKVLRLDPQSIPSSTAVRRKLDGANSGRTSRPTSPLRGLRGGHRNSVRARSKPASGPSGRDVSLSSVHPRRTATASRIMGYATSTASQATYPGLTRPRVGGKVLRAKEEQQSPRSLSTLRMRASLS